MSDRQRDTGIREIAIKNPDLVASYSTIFLQVASRGTPFSGEDVTRAFRERDGRRPTHPNWFGAMFGNITAPARRRRTCEVCRHGQDALTAQPLEPATALPTH